MQLPIFTLPTHLWEKLVDRFHALDLSENAVLLGFAVAVGVAGALGVVLFLSMAHFLWRDVGSFVAFALQLGFYLTPIVYPLAQVPERFHAWFLLNPLACLVLVLEWALFGMAMPSGTLWALAAWVAVIGGGGWWFFRAMKPVLGEAL